MIIILYFFESNKRFYKMYKEKNEFFTMIKSNLEGS